DIHSSDLLGKPSIAARVACIDILEKATRTVADLKDRDPDDSHAEEWLEQFVEALNHIALLARFGAGIPNFPERFGPIIGPKPGDAVTDPSAAGPSPATEAFKSGIAKYIPHSAEEAAWADGYT